MAAAARARAPTGDKLPEGKMPMRKLGRTGVDVSLVGLGGYHIGQAADEQTATRIIRAAIDDGINFMDNCWDYNEGRSHVWMGRALRDGYRKRVFLMTKIDGRTRKAAAAQIDQSLRDLGTDVIDLMQVHEVIRDADPGRVFGPDGAIEALVGGEEGGKDPLHRLHRPQEPGDSSEDAGDGGRAQVHVRHRADAGQRDGRPLRQLRAAGDAGGRRRAAPRCWR